MDSRPSWIKSSRIPTYTIIKRRDRGDAVLMSLDYYNSLMETLYLLESPANAEHLSKSIEQHREGRVQERGLVDG